MAFLRFFSLSVTFSLITACASHMPAPVAATSDSFQLCDEREPASLSPRCEDLFRLSIEARRNALKPGVTKSPKALPTVLTVEEIRSRHLRSLSLTLDEALDLLMPNAVTANKDQVTVFLRDIGHGWSEAQIREAIAKRTTFLARSKLMFSKTRNPDQDETLAEFSSRLRSDADVLLIEYALRMNARLFTNTDESRLVLRRLFVTENGSVLSGLFERKIGARNRRLLIRAQSDFIQTATHASPVTDDSLAREFFALMTPASTQVVLHDAIAQEPREAFTSELLKEAIRKGKATDVLALIEAGDLANSNASLFTSLLTEAASPLACEIFDRQITTLIKLGKMTDALAALRSFDLRRTVYANNPDALTAPYRSLLAHMSSQKGRHLVLREWMSLGAAALAAYVGSDARSPQRLRELLEANPKSPALASYVSRIDPESDAGRSVLANPKLKALLYREQPQFKSKVVDQDLAILHASDVTSDGLAVIVKNQDLIETELQRALNTVVQANAPPPLFAGQPRPWTAFLKSVPVSERTSITNALLAKNSSTPASLASFIAGLDPIEGVRDAVTLFLKRSTFTNSNRSDFTAAQVTQMFSGERFKKFFPYLLNANLSGAVRTKMIMAVRLNPIDTTSRLSPAWVREKFDADDVKLGAAEGYGFRPAQTHARLTTQLRDDLAGNGVIFSVPQQRRGLIVQGYYEASGISIMRRLDSQRGQAQVEAEAPALRNGVEAKLRAGVLAEAPLLERRLFTKYWALNSDLNLIGRFRQRAIWLAQNAPQFYDLRVEIHNFPTRNTLTRVEDFQRRLTSASPQFREQLAIIIRELSEFLNVSTGTNGLVQTIDRLPTSVEVHTALKAKLKPDADAAANLISLISIRADYDGAKNDSTRQYKEIERYSGDLMLSDAAVANATAWAGTVETRSIDDRLTVFDAILGHLGRDGYFTDTELSSWKQTLEKIRRDKGLEPQARIEVINEVLKGVIDQIYFRVVDDFGFQDNALFQTLKTDTVTPVHFIDDAMRSGMVFALSKIVDLQASEIAKAKDIRHSINDRETTGAVAVYNPGESVGVLRLNKNPMELSKDDIAVFDQMPGESAAVAGFITVGVGARLSHLQLLAKSLKIPNVQVAKSFLEALRPLDGKWVRVRADEDGRLTIEDASLENRVARSRVKVKLPKANHDIATPIAFQQLIEPSQGQYAGPKGVTLAKLFRSELRSLTPDGVVLPFGFFNQYVEQTGLKPLLETLSKIDLKNARVIGALTAQIEWKIRSTPIPSQLLDQVEASIGELDTRVGSASGYFFRSDTNVEDLPSFNGAGLNESVPNVPRDRARIEDAIRAVWISPFTEKSIFWRGEALGRATVTIAEPSIVIMPTAKVKASGVMLTRGGSSWESGHGSISANFGIGSVVEAGRPVEEYTFESGQTHRLSMSVSRTRPVAGANGGLVNERVVPGTPVLTPDEVEALRKLGQHVEAVLGDQPHGWDIEWGLDANDQPVLLQARPNM